MPSEAPSRFTTPYEVYDCNNIASAIDYISSGKTINLTGVSKATLCFVPPSPFAAAVTFSIGGSPQGSDNTSPFCLNNDKNMDEPQFRTNGSYTLGITVRNVDGIVIGTYSVPYNIIGGLWPSNTDDDD
jgi:hypothetical protein